MRELVLNDGYVAILDDDDYESVSKYNWRAKRHYNDYLVVTACVNKTAVSMGRFVLGLSDTNLCADHRDGNTLNNQKSNLRACTSIENSWNRAVTKNSKSGYIGVSFASKRNLWRACFTVKGKSIMLGYFSCVHSAANEVNAALLLHKGEFARLNVIPSNVVLSGKIIPSSRKGTKGHCTKTKREYPPLLVGSIGLY